jgi:hypothetical protein
VVSAEVALEQAGGVAAGFAFGDLACDVGLGGWVVLAAVQDDGVEGAVELAVATAAESVADGLAAVGWEWGDAGEAGEGGFGADAAWV